MSPRRWALRSEPSTRSFPVGGPSEAEEGTLDEVRRDLENSWPIKGSFPEGTHTRVWLDGALGLPFVFDSVIHPALIGLAIDSIAFADGQWVVSIRNERNETGRIFFTDDLKYLRAEKRSNDEQSKDHW